MGNRYKINGPNASLENGTNEECSRLSVLIADTVRDLGYKMVESHLLYVHRSLTREIAVYEKL